MAAHRYWRIYITESSGQYATIGEMEMRSVAGGADLCTGGTAAASSILGASYLASFGFDNVLTNMWHSQSGSVLPQWLSYDFGAGNDKDIVEIYFKGRGDGADMRTAPRAFSLQWSDDNVAWTTLFTMTTMAPWVDGEFRAITWNGTTASWSNKGLRVNTQYAYAVSKAQLGALVNTQYAYAVSKAQLGALVNTQYGYWIAAYGPDTSPSQTRRYWRILILKDQRVLGGGNYYCNICEFNLLGPNRSEIAYTGASYSSTGVFGGYPETNGFDNNSGSTCSLNMNVNPETDPRWLRANLGSAKTLHGVSLTAWDNVSLPKDFDIQYSDDDIVWTTWISVRDHIAGTGGVTYSFDPVTNPATANLIGRRAAQIIG